MWGEPGQLALTRRVGTRARVRSPPWTSLACRINAAPQPRSTWLALRQGAGRKRSLSETRRAFFARRLRALERIASNAVPAARGHSRCSAPTVAMLKHHHVIRAVLLAEQYRRGCERSACDRPRGPARQAVPNSTQGGAAIGADCGLGGKGQVGGHRGCRHVYSSWFRDSGPV